MCTERDAHVKTKTTKKSLSGRAEARTRTGPFARVRGVVHGTVFRGAHLGRWDLLGPHACAAQAGPVRPAGSPVGPWQAPVLGDALLVPRLPAPQLAAHVRLGGVGAVHQLLTEHLLALQVQAEGGTRRITGQRHAGPRRV